MTVKKGILQTPTEVRGIVGYAICDFTDMSSTLFILFHGEIGLAKIQLLTAFMTLLMNKSSQWQ